MQSRFLILAFVVTIGTIVEVLPAWKPFPGIWWTFQQAMDASGFVLVAAVVWLFIVRPPAR